MDSRDIQKSYFKSAKFRVGVLSIGGWVLVEVAVATQLSKFGLAYKKALAMA